MPVAKAPYIIPIFIPFLGCPFTCVYCQQESITGQKSVIPSVQEIQQRIRAFLRTRRPRKYSHTEVAFYGGTFTGLAPKIRKGLLSAVLPFLRSGEVERLRASTKPDYINSEVLAEVRDFGMTTVELGVQSLSDEVLRATGRGYRVHQVGEAVDLLRDGGFELGIQLMPGLPGAGEGEALETTEKVIELRPNFVRVYPTVVLKNTALATLYRQGRYEPWPLDKAIQVCRKIKARYLEAKISIIKMGLEFSTDEREGILAGPYHPRFHQLVQ